MRIGVPTEIKNNENRVAMTPAGVVQLVKAGHEVFIQKGAGHGSGFTDNHYLRAGATLVDTAAEAWSMEMVMKVKEPIPVEYSFFREDQILFTYLHGLHQDAQKSSRIKLVGISLNKNFLF